ncbi:Plasmodium exported protein (PHISTc), unknown function [Plasmodium sp. gorilla clade G2]|uniref:Plasmodium exported protein (PHISTc), unknown function n=1 Tax=Plasmodium sp. gorilla clade G2 TaxID=880535 RepID=UPI000D2114BD|nr:Plasmodium exported protein (PHISTc), unknown function [Plasmodium sp. gorilla clade G2]SOV11988.1 Plasmodium exported protein (PHISTc), unknown function [Plasmodium sp. gorilla clade G2]
MIICTYLKGTISPLIFVLLFMMMIHKERSGCELEIYKIHNRMLSNVMEGYRNSFSNNEKKNKMKAHSSMTLNYTEQGIKSRNLRKGPKEYPPDKIRSIMSTFDKTVSKNVMYDTYYKLHNYQRKQFLRMVDEIWEYTITFSKENKIDENYRSKYFWECNNILQSNLTKMDNDDKDNFDKFLESHPDPCATEEFVTYMDNKIKLWDEFIIKKKNDLMLILKERLQRY